MALKLSLADASNLQVVGGERQDNVITFGDKVERITLGRDPATCNVIFPESETKVGREHCAFKCELGRYQLVLNRDDLVLINGRPAVYGDELESSTTLQLGQGGPTLRVETELNPQLKPTDMRVKQSGQMTVVREAGRKADEALARAKRVRFLSAAAILLVAVVGVVSYVVANKQQVLTVAQKERIDNLSEQLTAALKAQEQLQEMLKKAASSVYLVIEEDSQGNRSPQGTAWVLNREKGYLGTNAHMVEIFQKLNLDSDVKGHKLLVRSTGDNPQDFYIKSIMKHPGYDATDDLWKDYMPYRQDSEVSAEDIGVPGNFCDVGIYVVENPEGLGPDLPLVNLDTLKLLTPSYPLALIGFPMEGIALGGVNVKTPTPTTQLGHIVSLTDYFGASNVDFAERLLVQHAVPSTGGASGSPILNTKGEVVAVHNASNHMGDVGFGRIGNAALINYAQRIDLFNELTGGDVDSIQKARDEVWKKEVASFFQKKSDVMDRVEKGKEEEWNRRQANLNDFFAEWQKNLPPGFSKEPGPKLLTSKNDKDEVEMVNSLIVECKDSEADVYGSDAVIHVNGKGRLCIGIVAYHVPMSYIDISDGANTALDLDKAHFARGGVPAPGGRFVRDEWMATLEFDVPGPGDYTVHALTKARAFSKLRVEFAAEVPSANPPTIPLLKQSPSPWEPSPVSADSMAAVWLLGKADRRGWQAKLVWQGTAKLNYSTFGNWAATQPLGAYDAGDYFAVAHASDNETIALQLFSEIPNPFFGFLAPTDNWAQSELSLKDKSKDVEISVVGPNQGVEISLYVYKAMKPAGILP